MTKKVIYFLKEEVVNWGQPKIPHYSTVTDLSERVKLDLPEQILEFTISVSSNQYNYTKQERVLTKPVISSIKLISI
jgi:hypothetical protein